jgi:nitroimidazol reductase NimA-like FMN-containing flavoprotein (pyridoxamine 5'-phosphate oxidase superfamily)
MKIWADLIEAAPELGEIGRQRLEGRIAYLATIRPDGSPRVHPVSPFIGGGHLFVHMEPTSPKGNDLRRDARYALHCAVEDNSGGQGEFVIRGQALEVSDQQRRAAAFAYARAAGYTPQARYVLFELTIAEAVATTYPDDQPRRQRWKAI